MSRNRVLEAVLGSDLFDAATAERCGWVNRALPDDQLDEFVERLARNIAALPDGVISAAKRAVPPQDMAEGMLRESELWFGLVLEPEAERLMSAALAGRAQTRGGERDLEGVLRQAATAADDVRGDSRE